MNRSVLFLVIAIVLFSIALLLAAGIVSGSHVTAWIAGGLIAFAAAHLP